ncbi:putative transcriptional regulatory protein [Paramyrothecium foliicola]|nr:putative transcriptional regulatory protein [Paramyrothecium foliicola]
MAENPDAEDRLPVDDLTAEEASRIIHSHRKVRHGVLALSPAQGELCSYKPNRSAATKHQSTSDTSQGRKRSRSFSDAREDANKAERLDNWRSIASLDDSDSAGDRYLGQNSIPALLREQSSPNHRDENVDIRRDMRSILGLDTSAPFPLMSSHHLQRLTQDITNELPSDREVMKLFRTYKEVPQPFWGFVADIDELESNLMAYLEDRSRNASSTVRSSRPVTASWLAVLFGVLAVGSQYHESPYHIRTRDSQKYIQISFHFLRLGNFLLRPSFDSIQALLLTSFVLLNDMKAEASWALIGLTCRLAQALGLHRPDLPENREKASTTVQHKEMMRRKIWWSCVWHDTLISLSFDRCSIPIGSESNPGEFTYIQTMHHLIDFISRNLGPGSLANATYAQVLENCEAIEVLRSRARPQIRDREKCKTALDRLQYFAIRLHSSFVISVACRPALKRDCPFEPQQKKALADRCKDNLTETVRMFLAMHQLSVIPTRSWAFTYHGLSSALLLGILCETKTDPEVRQLQGDLIAALSATAAKDASSPEPHVIQTDKDIELSGPLWRALTALKNIYDHGSVNGSNVKKEGDSSAGGSRARTPLPPFTYTNQFGAVTNTQPQLRGMQPGSDPREDAALAMAEMQNGASLQDFSGSDSYSNFSPAPVLNGSRIPYAQQLQPNVGVGMDMANMNIDPAQYMAPMDLFDSIWGESPDPWNTGVDAMNFDFLAQPPPGQPQQQFYF